MRLEMPSFPVKEVAFGKETRYRQGTLEIDKQEILNLILEDNRIASADVELVAPWEEARITYVNDVVEPRVKVQGPGCVFPGMLGGMETAGSGRTHRIPNLAVVVTGQVPSKVRSGTEAVHSGAIDTKGPGAGTRVSLGHMVVLLLNLQEGFGDLDYHYTNQVTAMKVAKRLAEATIEQTPEAVEVYELTEADPKLPRVVFIQGILTNAHQQHPDLTYYGWPVRWLMSFYVHPNEFLDGALAPRAGSVSGISPTTWHFQNHPILEKLYAAHGKRFNWLGVILERIRGETFPYKELIANQAAKLAKTLGAQGAIVTWTKAGNAFIDTMLTVQACEKQGIKSVLVTYEYGGAKGIDNPLLYQAKEADAIVSLGTSDQDVDYPAMKRIVGPREMGESAPGSTKLSMAGEFKAAQGMRRLFIGGTDLWGERNEICREY